MIMKNLIKISIICLFVGCRSTERVQNSEPLESIMVSHARNGATSVEVMLESLKKSDFDYLAREKATYRTNYYSSGREKIPFLEVDWK